MKKKNSEPLKYTFSFEDRISIHEEFIEKFMALAKLACDAGTDKDLKSDKYKNDEERVEARLRLNEVNRKFLNGLEQRLREDKNLEKLIAEDIAKRKFKKNDT